MKGKVEVTQAAQAIHSSAQAGTVIKKPCNQHVVQEFLLATQQGDLTAQHQALQRCIGQPDFPADMLEALAVKCAQTPDASSANQQLSRAASKAALLSRLRHLTPDSAPQAAQVSLHMEIGLST